MNSNFNKNISFGVRCWIVNSAQRKIITTLLAILLNIGTFAQKGYQKVIYYGKDTNVTIEQWQKVIRKSENFVTNSTFQNNKKKFGTIEGYTQVVDGDLLIFAIDLLDTTKRYFVIGSCVSMPCNPEKDGVDCDGCIPIHFKLILPINRFYTVGIYRLEYNSNNTFNLEIPFSKIDLSDSNSSSMIEFYSLFDFLNLYNNSNYFEIKNVLNDYIIPILVGKKTTQLDNIIN